MSTTDIIVVSYAPDVRWLFFLLKSLRKYARGFRDTIVVFPAADAPAFADIRAEFPAVAWREFNQNANGHMHHNIMKCRADEQSDADYFFHIDSDCVLMGKTTPGDYMTNGRPDIVYSKFADVSSPWRAVTEGALGRSVEVETMRRHPFLYPRWLYGALREHVQRVHGVPFDTYVFSAPARGGAHRGFSEFCALGAYAKHFVPSEFHFYDTANGVKPAQVRQYWSFSGITESERHELEVHVRDWDKPQIFDSEFHPDNRA